MDTKKIKIDYIKIQFILLLVLSISQFIGNSIMSLAVTILICAVVVIADIKKSTVMLFQLMPFFNLLNNKIGNTSFYYLIIIIYLFKFVAYKKLKLSNKKLLVLLYFSLLRLMCGNMEVFIKWFLLFSVVVVLFNNELLIQNLEYIIKTFCISMIISSACGYIMLITGKSIYTGGYVYSKELGAVTRFAGLIGDPVFYSQICSIAIGSLLVIMYNTSIKMKDICIIVVLFIFTLLSYSKTGIILCSIAFAVFLICKITKNVKSKKNGFIAILLVIACVLGGNIGWNYIEKTNNDIVLNYTTRFESKDLLTGRSEIFAHYIYLLKKNIRSIFIGISDSEYTAPFYISTGLEFNRSHNIYIETVAVFGLLTTIVILCFILYEVIKYILKRTGSLINLLPLILLLLSGVTLHGHYEFHYYTLVTICFAFLFYKPKKERNKKNEVI